MKNRFAHLAAFAAFACCAAWTVDPAHGAPCAGQAELTCDDGSPCSSAADCPDGVHCTSNCFAGRGSAESECLANLLGARLNHPPDSGPDDPVTKKEIRCTDGDFCDADGVADNRCTFELKTCLHNTDESGVCPSDLAVTAVTMKNKKRAKADAGITNLQTRARLLLPAASAACSTSTVVYVPVLSSDCINFKAGKRKISLGALAGPELLKDSDTLKLTCLPAATAACGSVRGYVTGPQNVPVSGARVVSGARSTVADLAGVFELSVEKTGRVALQISKEGYLSSVKLVDVTAGVPASVAIALLRSPVPFSVDVSAGGTATDPAGSRITLPPDALVAPNGQPLPAGTLASVSIASIDPSTSEVNAFPGGFDALGAGGAPESLQSISLAEVSAVVGGEHLQLAPGKTALLELVIPVGAVNPQTVLAFAADDIVPMYWLNPLTGLWESEGSGTVGDCTTLPSRLCVKAAVNHLSWWNADIPMEVTCVRGHVVDSSSVPMSGANVSADGLDYAAVFYTQSNGAGEYCLRARVASNVQLSAWKIASDGIRETASLAPVSTSATPGNCEAPETCTTVADLVVPSSRACVRGRTVLENGTPVAGAQIDGTDSVAVTSGTDGKFCTAAAPDREMFLVGEKGPVSGSAPVHTGSAGATCAVTDDCDDAGDLVLTPGGCGGSLLTGVWRNMENAVDYHIVENSNPFQGKTIGMPVPFPFSYEHISITRNGLALLLSNVFPGYRVDCETMIFDLGSNQRATFKRVSSVVCGDGTVAGGEECDDGNTSDADGCAFARCEAVSQNVYDCKYCVTKPVGCGDAVVGGSEQCDDGNVWDFDMCLPDCTSPICGNGHLDRCQGATQYWECTYYEECDDGDTDDGDGCSSQCVLE